MVSRQSFGAPIRNLGKAGITILVSTPYMDEAGLCDRVALVQGRILTSIPRDGKKFSKPLWRARAADMYRLMKDLKADDRLIHTTPLGNTIMSLSKKKEEIALKNHDGQGVHWPFPAANHYDRGLLYGTDEPMNREAAISVSHLTKRFGDFYGSGWDNL